MTENKKVKWYIWWGAYFSATLGTLFSWFGLGGFDALLFPCVQTIMVIKLGAVFGFLETESSSKDMINAVKRQAKAAAIFTGLGTVMFLSGIKDVVFFALDFTSLKDTANPLLSAIITVFTAWIPTKALGEFAVKKFEERRNFAMRDDRSTVRKIFDGFISFITLGRVKPKSKTPPRVDDSKVSKAISELLIRILCIISLAAVIVIILWVIMHLVKNSQWGQEHQSWISIIERLVDGIKDLLTEQSWGSLLKVLKSIF